VVPDQAEPSADMTAAGGGDVRMSAGCGSIATFDDGRGSDHLTSFSCGRGDGSGLGTAPLA